ncbi:unnamed protein product [Blepharisma stoltei]|uniref:Uncharacterized protein n=1 Tax=Blepharisma stoltei TaxID=1481888 RepID=A0AAU9I675_9CILI|nr:unnamed protein product [Blepharisma stoltei]
MKPKAPVPKMPDQKSAPKIPEQKSAAPSKSLKLKKNDVSSNKLHPSLSSNEEIPKKESQPLLKEIQNLKIENGRLSELLAKTQEELKDKDEFMNVINSVPEVRHDERRYLLYRAKIKKQERMINHLQNALEAHKRVYFETDNWIASVSQLSENSENAVASMSAINGIMKIARAKLKEAEHYSKIAYTQLINNLRSEEVSQYEIQGALDWRPKIKLNGNDILDAEMKIGELLNAILSSDNSVLETLARESCTKLIKLGTKLPSIEKTEEDYLSKDSQEMILMQVKAAGKNYMKAVISKMQEERSSLKMEKEMILKEIENKNEIIEKMANDLEFVKNEYEKKSRAFYGNLECNLVEPWNDIWSVYENIENASSSIQLCSVFKMLGPKINDFIIKISQ